MAVIKKSNHDQVHSTNDMREVLVNVLKGFCIPEQDYSIGEYAEEAICLEKSGADWIVYGGEKGQRHDIKTHADCKSACLDLIARVSGSDDEEKKLAEFFIGECGPNILSVYRDKLIEMSKDSKDRR